MDAITEDPSVLPPHSALPENIPMDHPDLFTRYFASAPTSGTLGNADLGQLDKLKAKLLSAKLYTKEDVDVKTYTDLMKQQGPSDMGLAAILRAEEELRSNKRARDDAQAKVDRDQAEMKRLKTKLDAERKALESTESTVAKGQAELDAEVSLYKKKVAAVAKIDQEHAEHSKKSSGK
eukprot:TRINITY_DN65445_c0_g1_i2.p2 TRINITY_DN65445_c0_g1~~TRINITY_DN65445_c0_g1_i2.p2  ORF type:complete len:178 (+),score=116.30 TRINITY_DN65445_c0_g1_i2:200-733(+)